MAYLFIFGILASLYMAAVFVGKGVKDLSVTRMYGALFFLMLSVFLIISGFIALIT